MSSKMKVQRSTNSNNKTTQSEAVETANELKTYLDNLNDDCLIAILDLLDEIDLVRLCDYNERFCSLIKNHVISRKLFDFAKIRKDKADTEKVFELFGKTLRKIKINLDDIQETKPEHTKWDEFLSLVQAHCTADKIVDLDIFFTIVFNQHTEELLADVIPLLRNIINLRIQLWFGSNGCNRFLKMLFPENVRSIDLSGMSRIDFNWLRTTTFGNLQHLNLSVGSSFRFENVTSSEAFFESQPNLKTMRCGDQLIGCLESIAKHSSNIENLSRIRIKHYDSERHVVVDSLSVVKAGLPKLKKINTMEIKAVAVDGSDLYEILDCISENNVLCSLTVHFAPDDRVPGKDVNLRNVNFTSLTYLHLILPKSKNSDVNNILGIFLRVGLPHMTNVKKIIIDCRSTQNDLLLEIVKTMNHLCVLDLRLVSVRLRKQDYEQLVEARKHMQRFQSKHNPLTIIMSRYEVIISNFNVYDENTIKLILTD